MNEVVALRRWLAILRVMTGGIFVYIGTTHLLGGWATAEGFQQAISRMGGASPFQWYTAVMVPLVLSAPGLFGPLFTYGMIATGLGLVFGLLTRVAIVAGLWLNLNNLLMGFAGGGVHHGINILMAAVQLAVWQTGLWRTYSLDGLIIGRGPSSRPPITSERPLEPTRGTL